MNKLKALLVYIISIHLISLLILSVLRVILLFVNIDVIENVGFSYVLNALIRGVWFDNVIACYITILPLVIASIFGLCNKLWKGLIRTFSIYYFVLYGIVIGLSVADIPYFSYFFKHLNSSIFNWKEEGGTAMSMILQEKSYYIYFLIYIILFTCFSLIINKLSKKVIEKGTRNIHSKQYILYIPLCIILVGLTCLGIRGRLGRNPIKTSQAYFCNNSFLNQLGLNPTFFLIRNTIENSKKHISVNDLETKEEALRYVQKTFGVPVGQTDPSPIARKIEGDDNNKHINVVFILMESMSADFLKVNDGKLTPFLNELKNESYYFDNFYSAGNHTNHGITATLFGLPSLFDKNMMKNVDIPYCYGIPNILQERGYNTSFFVTHESQYDNMNAFLLENGIQRMYAQEDYPASKVVNGFGVQDDYLFEYAINKLNTYAKEDAPFFATILTISNHPPYIVPDKYKAISNKAEEQIVAFADDAVRQFITAAKQQPWYENTIFVLLGDHGKIVGKPTYDMPLSYNHIPFFIHSPLLKDSPQIIHKLGGQVDVFPTIMGLLNYSYINNSLGVDILKEERPYMYFTSDDLMGCINQDYFYIYNPVSKAEGIYDYRTNNTTNRIDQNKMLADSMKLYGASMLITTDYLIENKLTQVHK